MTYEQSRIGKWTWILITVYLIKYYIFPLSNETKLSLGYHKDSLLNFTELTKKYGYTTEEHDIITEDGYILTMFHVVNSKKCREQIRKTPVLLMHGLFESADVFLDASPDAGLGYLLPDACFDLWVGNQRGSCYGRRHTHLDPDEDARFWQFTAEEMSSYDLPAMYDYILNYTCNEKLNYVGYSQGGSNFFIMCSERPEYCQKTKVMVALAPSVLITNMESLIFKVLSQGILIAKPILEIFEANELFNKGGFVQELFQLFCQFTGTYVTDELCGTGGAPFDRFHPGSMSYETQKTSYGHFPVGTSIRNVARYGQILRSGKFQKYDYGETVNLEKYGSKEPPELNISSVTVPVVTVHGRNDLLVVPHDMETVEGRLPNLIEAVKVADPLWTHLDIVYSQFSNKVIFPVVRRYLDEYSDG